MTKAPTPTEISKGQSDNTNNATKKFDYTAVADRPRDRPRIQHWPTVNLQFMRFCICHMNIVIRREKGRDLTQSCDKNPYTHRTIQKAT